MRALSLLQCCCLGLGLALCLFAQGCFPAPTPVPRQVVRAACAMCVFQVPGAEGCYWAVEIEGKPYTVQGKALPTDHDAHAPDGMCNMARQAEVEGEIRGGQFLATHFALRPAENVPTQPQYSDEDKHTFR